MATPFFWKDLVALRAGSFGMELFLVSGHVSERGFFERYLL